MPTWLWILIAVVVLLGLVKLMLLPEQRRRRGLPADPADPATTKGMPSRGERRAEVMGKDPVTGMRQHGPL